MPPSHTVQRFRPKHAALVPGLLDMFGTAFDDTVSDTGQRPDAAYLHKLLAREDVFVMVAMVGE